MACLLLKDKPLLFLDYRCRKILFGFFQIVCSIFCWHLVMLLLLFTSHSSSSNILQYTFDILQYTFDILQYTFDILQYTFDILQYTFDILQYTFDILNKFTATATTYFTYNIFIKNPFGSITTAEGVRIYFARVAKLVRDWKGSL